MGKAFLTISRNDTGIKTNDEALHEPLQLEKTPSGFGRQDTGQHTFWKRRITTAELLALDRRATP